jgi:hypothetical protein
MSRAVFEAVPVATEMELRLRRVEERIARIEAASRGPATPPAHATAPAPATPPASARATHRRWAELADRLDALALKLKLHYEQAGGDGVPRALDELRDSVREAFTAAGNAIQDDAVRADVREVGVMVAEAVADGLSTVGSDLRDAVHHPGQRKEQTP